MNSEQKKNTEYPYEFSIIMAVYNVEPYLKEAVDSVLKQTFDFKKVQIILVDDGSPDKSGEICDAYAKKYPENIFVIHKENGGVSSARNAGLAIAKGRYVNFMDPDDKISSDTLSSVYAFFDKYGQETDVVTIKTLCFGGRKGAYHLNWRFSKEDKVADLNGQEYEYIQKAVATAFFQKSALKDIKFDENLAISEDVKFVTQVLTKRMKLGFCAKGTYFYRIRQTGVQSALQGSKENRSYYINTVENAYEWMIAYSKEKFGKVLPYFQSLLINELYWRISPKDIKPNCLTQEEWFTYQQKTKALCSYLDTEVVAKAKGVFIDEKVFMLFHKFNALPDLVKSEDGKEVSLFYGDRKLSSLSSQLTRIEFIKLKENSVHIEGFARFVGVSEEEEIGISLQSGEEKFSCEIFDRNTENRKRFGFPLYKDIGFKAEIPLSGWGRAVRVGFSLRGTEILRKKLSYGKFSPVGIEYKKGYYWSSGWAVKAYYGSVFFQSCGRRGKMQREFSFLFELFRKCEWKNLFSRMYYHLFRTRGKKEFWLLSDRPIKGDDNGEAMFDYLLKNKKKEVKAAFLIRKGCKDYERLKKIGKIVSLFSGKAKLKYLIADKLVSSSGDEEIMYPIQKSKAFRDIIANKKYVFLQHGVTQADLTGWLNKYNKNIYKFITTTRAEYESILNFKYFYGKDVVKLTGFCRYDRLYHDEKRQIVIMPTWRQYLVGLNIDGVRRGIANFESSNYFKFYNALINDERILSAAEKSGFTIAFLPHPNTFNAYIDKFQKDERVVFLDTDIQYRKVFAESNLLITDYSSVAFDFAYLRKPVLYCQFDREEFYGGGHIAPPGYFDYFRDGFGEVCTDYESTVKTLLSYIESGCRLKEEYAERIENTFAFSDRKNCERVYNAIMGK